MRIIKLSRYNMSALERELDRIGLKHDIEPRSPYMPTPDMFGDFDEDEDDDYDEW